MTPVELIMWVEPDHDTATMDWLSVPIDWKPDAESKAAFLNQRQSYYETLRPWPGAIEKMEFTHIDTSIFPKSTIESSIKPNVTFPVSDQRHGLAHIYTVHVK